jgi:hypothetical protein
MNYSVRIKWNGTTILEGRCGMVMAYELLQLGRQQFSSISQSNIASLDDFINLAPGAMISGKFSDETPKRPATGKWEYVFIRGPNS